MIIDDEIIAKEVVITENSIKAKLKDHKNKPCKCLFEYVWNALDAKANIIDIDYKLPEGGVGNIEYVEVTDNGDGFPFNENPNIENFLDSTKKQTHSKDRTLPKGQNGIGRYDHDPKKGTN
ncbi:MAG: ATP-binding protein [Candidatus Melainabacteria bacterium]|jgi:DNA topoisomerase VI subunit B